MLRFQYCVRTLKEALLLGFEMSQKSNVTPEHTLFECSLDLNLQKLIHCVCL